jgi:hypothetical protein
MNETPMSISDSLEGEIVVIALAGQFMEPEQASLLKSKVTHYLDSERRKFILDLERSIILV